MTSFNKFAASENSKKRSHDNSFNQSCQSNDFTSSMQKFVEAQGVFGKSGRPLDSEILGKVPESIRNFFVLFVNQVKTINGLYDCLNHLLENSQSLFDNRKIIDQVHKASNNGIIGLKMLTESIIENLNSSCLNTSDSSLEFVEPAVKLRRFETSITDEDRKPSFEDDDIDLAGSDIELQLCEDMTNKDCEIKPAAQSSYKFNPIVAQSSYKFNSKPAAAQSSYKVISTLKKSTLPYKNDESPGSLKYDPDGYVQVFIDGSCLSNGRANPKAGIGVWFGDQSPLNVSEPAKGTPTNNNAEIQAATKAVLKANSAGVKKLRVYTDSQFVINCMTTWIRTWKRNNWTTSANKPVKNKDSLMELDKVIPLLDALDWAYVEGHKGIIGNERADFLAKQGARQM